VTTDSLPRSAGALPVGLADSLASLRSSGQAADGLVSAQVDGAGTLVAVTFSPKVMRMASQDLAEAVVCAVTEAQTHARSLVSAQVHDVGQSFPHPDALRAQLSEISLNAERRMAEISSALQDVMRRVGG
jgi:DNA-binding protein YbaB